MAAAASLSVARRDKFIAQAANLGFGTIQATLGRPRPDSLDPEYANDETRESAPTELCGILGQSHGRGFRIRTARSAHTRQVRLLYVGGESR